MVCCYVELLERLVDMESKVSISKSLLLNPFPYYVSFGEHYMNEI